MQQVFKLCLRNIFCFVMLHIASFYSLIIKFRTDRNIVCLVNIILKIWHKETAHGESSEDHMLQYHATAIENLGKMGVLKLKQLSNVRLNNNFDLVKLSYTIVISTSLQDEYNVIDPLLDGGNTCMFQNCKNLICLHYVQFIH